MILQQHLSGTWWPVNAPHARHPGTLSFSRTQGGHLHGTAAETAAAQASSPEVSVIHGRLAGPADAATTEAESAPLIPEQQIPEQPVSLFGMLPLQADDGEAGSGPAGEGDFAVDAVLVGDIAASPEEHRYRQALIDIPELTPWVTGVAATRARSAQALGGEPVSVAVPCRIGQDPEAHSLRFTLDPSSGCVSLEVTDPAHEGLSVEEVRRNAHAVQDLFALASLTPPASMQVRLPADDLHGEAQLFWRQTLACPLGVPRETSLIFSAQDIDVAAALPRWYELRRRHRVTVDLLMGMLRAPHRYPELNLLVVVAAAEALFATTDDRSKRQRKDTTLRLKLVAMAERVELADRVTIGLPIPEWAERTARVRNSFTHTGGSTDYTERQIEELVSLTRAVVVANLVQDLGVPAAVWSRGFARNPVLRRLRLPGASTLG